MFTFLKLCALSLAIVSSDDTETDAAMLVDSRDSDVTGDTRDDTVHHSPSPPVLREKRKRLPKPLPLPREPSTRIKSDNSRHLGYHMYTATTDYALLTDTSSEIRFADVIQDRRWREAMEVEMEAHFRNGT